MAKRGSETLNEAIATAVTEGGMTTQAAVHQFGMSQRWIRALARRARLEGKDAAKRRSKRPKTTPSRTPEETRQRIFFIRDELTRAGLDAGPESIWDRLDEPRPHPTIYRVLRDAGKVETNPKKRPKRSYIRFQAGLPNQMWQSDFTDVLSEELRLRVLPRRSKIRFVGGYSPFASLVQSGLSFRYRIRRPVPRRVVDFHSVGAWLRAFR